jgi:hypothetical protein
MVGFELIADGSHQLAYAAKGSSPDALVLRRSAPPDSTAIGSWIRICTVRADIEQARSVNQREREGAAERNQCTMTALRCR